MAALMQALITAPGNTAVVSHVPIPEPGDNEILIRVHSLALNPVDSLFVAHPADKPGRVVGSDVAGSVEKLGKNVTEWAFGDRVAGLLQGATSANFRPGGFAEYAVLESDLVIRVPSGSSYDEAATLPLSSLTAAQALFIRLEINAPFPSPFKFQPPTLESPAILIYSGATSIGLFAIELSKTVHTPSGKPYRIFATASPKNHEKLLSLGVEAVFDYRSPIWPEEAHKLSGGVSYAFDCISEGDSTANISRAFGEGGGKIAVIRKGSWNQEGVRSDVTPLYGAAWAGLGHEIVYRGEILPANPSWRALTVAFFKYLSRGSPTDSTRFPIVPIPIRLMPGGLDHIVPDAFTLIGAGGVGDRVTHYKDDGSRPWMKPISGEKLVYRIEADR